jgi:hypothetical protein
MRNRLRKLICAHHVVVHDGARVRHCAGCGTRV